jgi:hypothetical protein
MLPKVVMDETNPLETVAKRAQRCLASNPVVVLGSGASLHHGLPGMSELQMALVDSVRVDGDEEAAAWSRVQAAINRGDHLEKALTETTLPVSLITKIISATWKCINQKDREVYLRALAGTESFPISKLYQRLFQSSNPAINVVTTNYGVGLLWHALDAADEGCSNLS